MSDPHIEKIRSIFLGPDVDEETRRENEDKIIEWQRSLSRNRAYAEWKDNDITVEIIAEVKRRYKEATVLLAFNRQLNEKDRYALWAEQDAARLILSLLNEDAKAAIASIHKEIQVALNATN